MRFVAVNSFSLLFLAGSPPSRPLPWYPGRQKSQQSYPSLLQLCIEKRYTYEIATHHVTVQSTQTVQEKKEWTMAILAVKVFPSIFSHSFRNKLKDSASSIRNLQNTNCIHYEAFLLIDIIISKNYNLSYTMHSCIRCLWNSTILIIHKTPKLIRDLVDAFICHCHCSSIYI